MTAALWRQQLGLTSTRTVRSQTSRWPAPEHAYQGRALHAWHCAGRSLPCRMVTCSLSPSGRFILPNSGPDDTEQQMNTAAGPTPSSLHSNGREGPFSPFSLFIALYCTRLSPDVLELAVAQRLWTELTLEAKVEIYQVLLPICMQLNEKSTPAHLLERVWADLPPSGQVVVGQHLDACRQRHLNPGQERSQHTARQLAQLPGRSDPGMQHDSRAMQSACQRIAADEANSAALHATMCVSGLSWHSTNVGAGGHGPGMRPAGDPAPLISPEVRLVTHVRAAPQPEFGWSEFLGKCRLAWDVFFPAKQTLSPAMAMRARLKMVLVSDRSGLDLPTLIRIRNESLSALAKAEGWDKLSELELQVASTRGDGEQVLALPLSQMPSPFMLRDSDDYDYEYADDDDYFFEEDTHQVSEVVEASPRIGAASQGPLLQDGP